MRRSRPLPPGLGTIVIDADASVVSLTASSTAPVPTPPGRSVGFGKRAQQRMFDALYVRSLIYNACWEDPALDRQALRLGPDNPCW